MAAHSISAILIRIGSQSPAYCPMCRHGAKHAVNIECLENFWRGLLPRKFDENLLVRGCYFFHGAPLMYLYQPDEYAYAVAAVHYGLAMCVLYMKTEIFWRCMLEFLNGDQELRKGCIKRKFALCLHVIETLAWRCKDGELFPTPLICWYFPEVLFKQYPELMEVVREIDVHKYT
jgi:hypothetical protein